MALRVIIVQVNATVYVPGRPCAPVISSEVESVYSDQFNLTWAVESHAGIRAYRIIYRKWMVSAVQSVQCSTVQYCTVMYSTVQYSNVQYSTVQ